MDAKLEAALVTVGTFGCGVETEEVSPTVAQAAMEGTSSSPLVTRPAPPLEAPSTSSSVPAALASRGR